MPVMGGLQTSVRNTRDNAMKLSFGLGKYRDLLFAILLFILLDLGILFFNFFASIQLERDASRIHSAGELRTLTQQMTKALLTLQAERKADLPIQTSMAQLSQGHAGFLQALSSLRNSLTEDIEFTAFGLDPATLRGAVARVEREWGPLEASILTVVATSEPSLEDTEIAVNKAVARNIRLMGLADDLAQGVQAAANKKTNLMRQIQVAAIVLALINFVYIVFKFLRRLNASDRQAEAARRETEDILNTVNEGLLLVRSDGTVGTQFSASIHKILMRKVRPGENFAALLDSLLSRERAEEARSFLRLLFDPKVKPALLTQLDPLRDIQIHPPAGQNLSPRYVTFQISQVRQGAEIKELLVTIFDVTQRIQLEQELAASQEAARSDVEDLIRVLEQEPAVLQEFLTTAQTRLADLNGAMRDVGRSPQAYRELVDMTARTVHGIKGESAALSLTATARHAHQLENALAPLRNRRDLTGEDFIPVVLELARVQDEVARLHRALDRLGRLMVAPSDNPAPVLDALVHNLRSLTDRVAASMGKQVRLTAVVPDARLPDGVTLVLREALPQLVRNAVVHGIESPQVRQSQGKAAVGELTLAVDHAPGGHIEVTLTDDGRGIAIPEVRRRAQALQPDASGFSDSQLLTMIFEDHFSTAADVTEHAGRGVGLALVRQIAEKAGVKLRVMTQPERYTRFILHFPANA